MTATEFVFAYGSNMDLAQMSERCPNSKDIFQPFVARADGWKLWFPRQSERRQGGVGSIISAPGEAVWGVVFGLTTQDLARLDRSEGVSAGAYRRARLPIAWGRDLKQEVWTYLAIPQDEPPMRYAPHEDYLAQYIRGAEYFKLPADYIDKLKRIETRKRRK
jgi:cation transport regulator ChaC